MLELIEKGGFMMYPIIFSSMIVFAVAVERFIVFSRIKLLEKSKLKDMYDLLEKGKVGDVTEMLNAEKTPLSGYFRAIVTEKTEERCEKAAHITGEDIIFQLNRRLSVLAVLGSLVPLMGLLGTVIGMIKVFSRVAAAGDMSDISILAGGIWEALVTTAAGMAVAIPTLLIFHYLERRIEKTAHRMQHKGEKIIEIMREQGSIS